jgi:hypothetical protein
MQLNIKVNWYFHHSPSSSLIAILVDLYIVSFNITLYNRIALTSLDLIIMY